MHHLMVLLDTVDLQLLLHSSYTQAVTHLQTLVAAYFLQRQCH